MKTTLEERQKFIEKYSKWYAPYAQKFSLSAPNTLFFDVLLERGTLKLVELFIASSCKESPYTSKSESFTLININDYFEDGYKPSQVELEEFELELGFKYPIDAEGNFLEEYVEWLTTN